MLIRRFIKLTLVVLLSVGLGLSVTQSDAQPFAGTGHATLLAAPDPGDCGGCRECVKPCVAAIACGAACASLVLTSDVRSAVSPFYSQRVAPRPDRQLFSAELRIPTPPPRLSHFI